MKKIFYFIASAIVALGAVACQNDIEENINNNQQTEGLSINVTIAEQTRVELGALNEETKQRKLTFTEGDVLVARSGYQEGTNYYFKYTKAEGDVYTFTCEDEGVSSLVGTKPHFFYLGGLHEQADELILHGAICNTAAENISGIGLSSNEVADDWTLGDAEYTVTLSANPILKFTANEPVTFSCDFSVFFVNGEATNEYTTTTTTGEIIYLPILSSSGIECTVTVTTESGFNKSFTKSLQTDKIYNLGTIEAPVAQIGDKKYTSLATAIEEANGNTIKLLANGEATAPCQIDKNGFELTATTGLLALKNYNNESGYYDVVKATETKVKVVGSHCSWDYANANANVMYKIDNTQHYVAPQITFNANTEFKIMYNNNWDYSFGANNTNAATINQWNTCGMTEHNIKVTAGGTYDIYWTGTKYYVANDEQGVAKPDATPEADFYLLPNSNWTTDNARFAVYFYNKANTNTTWVDMVDSDKDGVYEVSLPDNGKTYDYVIFCRMDPNKTANNWNNKWNQTKDNSSFHFNINDGIGKLHAIQKNKWDDNSSWID